MIQLNTGRIIQGSPSVGSWLNYGLGTANQNLPGYVVMLDPRGGPISGAANWSSGFMPAAYQGTHLRNRGEPVLDLAPKSGAPRDQQRDQIDTLNALNAEHLQSRPGYSELQARIASYELAFQLQASAPEVMDLSKEDRKTQEMYGLFEPKPKHKLAYGPAHFGRQCLIARRLVERGGGTCWQPRPTAANYRLGRTVLGGSLPRSTPVSAVRGRGAADTGPPPAT